VRGISTFWVLDFLATGMACTGCAMFFLGGEDARALGSVPLRLLAPIDVGSSASWSSLCFDPLVVSFDRALDKRFDGGLEVVVAVVFLEEAFIGSVFGTDFFRSRAAAVVATCFQAIVLYLKT
jgi:hypothetical protein